MPVRVGLNGFGRIGRNVMRHITGASDVKIVHINDPAAIEMKAHLLKYDSNYGIFAYDVSYDDQTLIVDGHKITTTQFRDPLQLPWAEHDVDIVIEGTGALRTRHDTEKHLHAGAKRVIITAPLKDADVTVVLGVNQEKLDPKIHTIISNASCTTNCLAPIAKVLHEQFGIEKALMTTTHSYTGDQRILDAHHKDPRRSRACALSMIPTSTGAAKTVGEVIPELKGKIDGFALRVPTPTVSVVDLTAVVQKSTTIEEVNAAFIKAAATKPLGTYLKVSDLPLVSIDYKKNPASSTVDLLSTMVIGGTLVKIVSWYDNEWGYSARIADLIRFVSQ